MLLLCLMDNPILKTMKDYLQLYRLITVLIRKWKDDASHAAQTQLPSDSSNVPRVTKVVTSQVVISLGYTTVKWQFKCNKGYQGCDITGCHLSWLHWFWWSGWPRSLKRRHSSFRLALSRFESGHSNENGHWEAPYTEGAPMIPCDLTSGQVKSGVFFKRLNKGVRYAHARKWPGTSGLMNVPAQLAPSFANIFMGWFEDTRMETLYRWRFHDNYGNTATQNTLSIETPDTELSISLRKVSDPLSTFWTSKHKPILQTDWQS